MTVSNLILNHNFTITVWVRVTGGPNIFTINRNSYTVPDDENLLTFGVHDGTANDNAGDDVYLYFLYAHGAEDVARFHDINSAYVYLDWSYVAVTAQWDSTLQETFVRLWSDNVTRGSIQFNDIVIDNENYSHFLGVE